MMVNNLRLKLNLMVLFKVVEGVLDYPYSLLYIPSNAKNCFTSNYSSLTKYSSRIT